MLECLRVGEMSRDIAAREGENGLAGAAAAAGEGLFGQRDGVRRENHVVELEQWVVRVDRLLLEDVEGRAGDPPVPERLGQRQLVNDRPARDVDEEGRRLHQSESARVE